MRSESKTNNIAQSTEDQKLINDSSELKTEDSEVKVEISTKLIDKICLHFNMIISKNRNKKSYIRPTIFDDDSSPTDTMEATLKSIIDSLNRSLLPPHDEDLAEEINATLIYLKENMDIFIRKGNLLTDKNISTITKLSFMLSNKTLVDNPFHFDDYVTLLFTKPAAKQRKKLSLEKRATLVALDKKRLACLERKFLNAIDHDLYFPTPIEKLTSIYEIPALSLFGNANDKNEFIPEETDAKSSTPDITTTETPHEKDEELNIPPTPTNVY